VEDDKAARKAIAAILKRHAFAVCEATTVAEAIEALAKRPQWILLDLMLPDGSGIDVLHHLRAENLASRVCIITGCSREMQNEALAAGAEQSFAKPLDVERLIGVLQT
jgi:two-component system KDP operon response regulator KdpE